MIKLKHVFKQFDGSVIFDDLNLEITQCGIHVFIGESGSGKSTLLNLIAGFEPVSGGEIIKSGSIATIFQNYELIDELSVKDNIYIAKDLSLSKQVKNEDMILDTLGLRELFEHYPKELSGGQKQRVGIARALFQNPSIILCDEPTESLDQENKHAVMKLLQSICEDCIVIMVTHDLNMIQTYGDIIYKIVEKNIVVDQMKECREFVGKEQNNRIDVQQVKHYLNKILLKKSVLFSLIISLLVGAGLMLFGFEKYTFQPYSTFDSVTVNRVYVSSTRGKFHADTLKIDEDIHWLVNFKSFTHNRDIHSGMIVPFTNEENLKIQGKKPEGLEVVLNSQLAEKFDDILDQEIVLNYNIGTYPYRINMKVVGIVEEKDVDVEAIYYDRSGVDQYLKNVMTSFNNPQYEYYKRDSTYFEIVVDYENIPDLYERLSKDIKLEMKNPMYDARYEEQLKTRVYQTVFQIVEILIALGILIALILYVSLDTKHYMKNCSIFASLNVDVEMIKKVYVRVKLISFTCCLLLVVLLQQFLYFSIFHYRLLWSDLFFEIGIILFIYLVYVINILVSLSKLKMENINSLLKDEEA